jgi:hypothetical protein
MDWLTKPEVMVALGIRSEHTLRTLVRSGKLPAFQLTRRLLFRPEDVAAVVENSRVGVADADS